MLNIAACIHGPYRRERKRRGKNGSNAHGPTVQTQVEMPAGSSNPKSTNSRARNDFDASTVDLDESNIDPALRTGVQPSAQLFLAFGTRDADSSDSTAPVVRKNSPRSRASIRTNECAPTSRRRRTRASALNVSFFLLFLDQVINSFGSERYTRHSFNTPALFCSPLSHCFVVESHAVYYLVPSIRRGAFTVYLQSAIAA